MKNPPIPDSKLFSKAVLGVRAGRRRARAASTGAAFVEAIFASVALGAVVAAGFLIFQRWARAAERFDERAQAFATAFVGCGRTTELTAQAAGAWRTLDPVALLGLRSPPRAGLDSAARATPSVPSRESIACNERSSHSSNEIKLLQRDFAQRLWQAAK